MAFVVERRRDQPISEAGRVEACAAPDPAQVAEAEPCQVGDAVEVDTGAPSYASGDGQVCAAAACGPPTSIGTGQAYDAGAPPPPPRADLGIGARRKAGVQSLAGADVGALGDLPLTRALLVRSLEETGSDAAQQIRFRIGEETLTTGQLRLAIDRDPSRFKDFLRAQGISVAELNEVLDDVVDGEVAPGTEIDLRAGSEVARAYRIGGKDGAIVDSHLDRSSVESAAVGKKSSIEMKGLAGQKVEGPGFFQAIGEALAEAAAWIGRLFCASWNPDTVTFNGRVDDGHFRALGRDAAKGEGGLALTALLGSPGGEAHLRRQLEGQKPKSATDAQWRRAINDYLEGAKSGIATETGKGKLPKGLEGRDAENVTLYLRAHGFSADAQRDVRSVLAQPLEVRSRALELLVSLPEVERGRMLLLFSAPAEPSSDEGLDDAALDRKLNLSTVQGNYTEGSAKVKAALFTTFADDGFRTPLDSGTAYHAALAADVDRVPEALRDRYLALLPKVGLDRSTLLSGIGGLQSALGSGSVTQGGKVLDAFEAKIASTHDLERLLGADGAKMQLTGPKAGVIKSPAGQRQVIDTFEAQNVRFRFDLDKDGPMVISARGERPGEISLSRYFTDAKYRDGVLARTGMNRAAFEGMLQNINTSLRTKTDVGAVAFLEGQRTQLRRELLQSDTAPPRKAEIAERLQEIDTQLELVQAPMNVELDISKGSRLHELFDLTNGGGPRHAQLQLSIDAVREGGFDLSVRLRAPGKAGRPGPEYTISARDMSELLEANRGLPKAKAAFEARYPGLDFEETVRGFSKIDQLAMSGHVAETKDGSSPVLDFRRSQKDPALEAVRKTMTDGVAGNTRGADHSFRLGAFTTSDETPIDHLGSDARVGAMASNQWFQYGVFDDAGYIGSREAEGRAKKAYVLGGKNADPAIVLDALFGLDAYTRTSHLKTGEHTKENGVAYGHTDDFLVDPRTGARAEGRDLSVLTFSGRGTASDEASFKKSSDRVRKMFNTYGGVPEARIESHHEPSANRMYRAIEAEVLNDPRAKADRLDAEGRARPRTVVVHFAGHTGSEGVGRDREVAGFILTDGKGGRDFFTPAQVGELNRRAKEQGVNLAWVVDACRAGELVNQARSVDLEAHEAAGTLPAPAQHLTGLREALIEQHVMLTFLHEWKPKSPMPTDTTLSRLGAEALRGGPGSAALTALQARRDRVVEKLGPDANESVLMTRYVGAIESQLEHRAGLAGVDGLEGIGKHGLVTGATQWRAGRGFMTFTSGPLENKITEALRSRLDPPPSIPRERPGVSGARP